MASQLPAQTFTASPSVDISTVQRDKLSVSKLWEIQWPVPQGTPTNDGFGVQPAGVRSSVHVGIDFTPGSGTPVHAVSYGTVLEAGWDDEYGWYVLIQHDVDHQDVKTLYAHMQASPSVSRGETLTRGAVLGYVGSTGLSTGAHLHFEVRINDVPIEPLSWLRAHL